MYVFIESAELNASSRHSLRTPEPASEELHDGHHLIAIARHAVSRFTVALDLCEFEQTLEFVFGG